MLWKCTQPFTVKSDQLCDLRVPYLYRQQFATARGGWRPSRPINRSVRDTDAAATVSAATAARPTAGGVGPSVTRVRIRCLFFRAVCGGRELFLPSFLPRRISAHAFELPRAPHFRKRDDGRRGRADETTKPNYFSIHAIVVHMTKNGRDGRAELRLLSQEPTKGPQP